MFRSTKEIWESSSGSSMLPTVVTRTVRSASILGTNNLPGCDHTTRALGSVIEIIARTNDGLVDRIATTDYRRYGAVGLMIASSAVLQGNRGTAD
jgi:hypothetical protein